MTSLTEDLKEHWASISSLLAVRNEREYETALERIGDLLDEIGTDEGHPLYGFMDALATLVHSYEEQHYPLPEASGADMLRFFMDEQGLSQSNLPEIGTQGVVSEVLNGKRQLNVRQIRALARRFAVSPAVFI